MFLDSMFKSFKNLNSKKNLAVISLFSLAGIGIFASSMTSAQIPKISPPAMKLSEPLPANLFVELAKIINPAVVNISTSAIVNRNSDPMQDMLEQFYGLPRNQRNKPRQMSLGTGFIIREDGLILTNNHVVAGADIIQVQLSEKSEKLYDAKLIGADARADIALIKINPDGKLPVAALGTSKDLEVGEWVAAFGNPFGHGHTITKGIVSSKEREIEEINKFPLLQTDASINPGNSGGPLVNTKGYVIGVNSAIDARAQGIGFAIPIDEVKKIIPDLESRGQIRKGYLGVGLGDIDEAAAEYLGLKDAKGSLVTVVESKGPAQKAGVKQYDIITEFNGRKIKNTTELMDAVADAPIGEKVNFKVMRDGKVLSMQVTVSERMDKKQIAKKSSKLEKPDGVEAGFNLGLKFTDITDRLREEWGYAEDLKKPIISEIKPDALGARIGVRPGDVVLDVNKKDVATAAEAAKHLKKGTNSMRVARGDRLIIITFDIP